jgi:ATP-dependent helicase/nuclease subunit A
VLDDQQCRLLTQETLDDLFEECFSGKIEISDAVQALVEAYAPDRDGRIRDLVLRLHRYTQSRPDAESWLAEQQEACAAETPGRWEHWLEEAFAGWRDEWRRALELESGFEVFDDCLRALSAAGERPDRDSIRAAADGILEAEQGNWDKQKTKRRKPFSKFFDEAGLLAAIAAEGALEADWQAVRGHQGALLALTSAFTRRFTAAKRELGGVDFPDLEQLALRLLRAPDGTASAVARDWQKRLDHVFVDECQDINGAQDAILAAVSRGGAAANRFLVGDVKQSIYRFRLADPDIFRGYESRWQGGEGQRIVLTENFRSRPGILGFVNELFPALMRESVGGVNYEPLLAGAGSPMAGLGDGPCVELHFLRKESENASGRAEDESNGDGPEDLSATELEARLVGMRLRELEQSGFMIWDKDQECQRKVEWRDMAILMRSPGPRTEVFAKVFHQCGIPLEAARAGFLDAIEVSDLVSLLQLLDNPLQDIPLLAVLRSPLVGLTLDELAAIRVDNDRKPFWVAMRQFASPRDSGIAGRLATFIRQVAGWRELVRQVGPSTCLERVLTDTHYDVLLGGNERGAQQWANVRRLLDLARQFDPYLRQGLHRFLRFLKALEDADESLEPAPPPASNAVRLMSIHKSKGLEFPVVALAGLGSRFNLSDLHQLVLLDSKYGLAAKAITGPAAARYPTLPFWLAERRQREQQLAEELRLLYVAVTRARERLICTGQLPRKDLGRWESRPDNTVTDRDLLGAQSPMNWLLSWLPGVTREDQWDDDARGKSPLMSWQLWDPRDKMLLAGGQIEADAKSLEPESVADPATVALVKDRLSWLYPHAAATEEPAKSSVSALRRRAVELLDDDAVHRFPGRQRPGPRREALGTLSAAERGILHHRFLQHVNIESAGSQEELAQQALALVRRGIFSEEEATALDMAALARFWASDVGRQIRERAGSVRRELPFTARFEHAEVRPMLGQEPGAAPMDEFVVVQGVIDLAVVLEQEIWLLDFKTDDVRGEALNARSKEYEPQVQLYAAALEKIHQKPVRHLWLHFLTAGETVELPAAGSGLR